MSSPNSREHFLDKIERGARRNEEQYWGCSQAVVDALQRSFGIGDKDVLRSASALAGGVASQREVCGALLGAIMAVGLMCGRSEFVNGTVARESEPYLEARARAASICERFEARFGSLRCADVWASVRGDEYQEFARFDTIEALEGHDKCGEVTGAAARIAAEAMLEPKETFQKAMDALAAEVAVARALLKREEGEN